MNEGQMIEIEHDGSIFTRLHSNRDACIITTNGVLRRDGKAVMGAGIAKYCRDTFPGIDITLGEYIREEGNHSHSLGWYPVPGCDYECEFRLFSFPTKDDWRENSKPALIRQSCREMMQHADSHVLHHAYMPCPGCSNGGLDYWKDVRPILLEELDDRFVVCIPGSIMKKKPKGLVINTAEL